MKKSYIIGGIIILIAMTVAMYSLKSSLASYVSVREAKSGNRRVQVAGILVKGTPRYDSQTHQLIFTLREDSGDEMVVAYDGARPANFDNTTKIVAIGKFDINKQAFMTKELLVKCPTKYEGRVKGK
jgi:cytochrome c-type biogenesis protein CcmE